MARVLRKGAGARGVEQLLASSPWFLALPPAVQDRVRDDTLERSLEAGQALGHDGDMPRHWFGVVDGLLKWSVNTPDGRTVTLSGQLAGSWFGEGTLLRGKPRRSDLVALRPSRVALLPLATFDWLRSTQAGFNEFLLQQINERLHWFMGHFAAYRLLDADSLVARALLGLVHPLCNPTGVIRLQIAQEELAHLTSLSRQRCNQALAALAQAGVLRTVYGGLEILDLAALESLAG